MFQLITSIYKEISMTVINLKALDYLGKQVSFNYSSFGYLENITGEVTHVTFSLDDSPELTVYDSGYALSNMKDFKILE